MANTRSCLQIGMSAMRTTVKQSSAAEYCTSQVHLASNMSGVNKPNQPPSFAA